MLPSPEKSTPGIHPPVGPESSSQDECLSCDERKAAVLGARATSWLAGRLTEGFYNALSLCLDELREEPKKILVVGGARQVELSRYLAFLFPASQISVLDTDAEATLKAMESIHCRLRFFTSDIESTLFPDRHFDLVIAHHVFEYVKDWGKGVDELSRITKTAVIWTTLRAQLWQGLTRFDPKLLAWMPTQGLTLPLYQPDRNAILREVIRVGRVQTQVNPWPWQMWMMTLKADREERLVLTR